MKAAPLQTFTARDHPNLTESAQNLMDGADPLHLLADCDYFFTANFR